MFKKCYYIFYANIFTARDWDRFGCEFFLKRGYKVVPIELFRFLKKNHKHNIQDNNSFKHQELRRIENIKEIEQIISSFSSKDLVVSALPLNKETSHIYALFTRYNIDYARLSLGKLPIRNCRYKGQALTNLEYLYLKYMDFRSFLSLLRTALFTMFAGGVSWFNLRPPKWRIRAGKLHSFVENFAPWPWRSEIISVPSMDTQIATRLIDNPPPVVENIIKKYAVVIDDGFLDHPDFDYHGVKTPISAKQHSKAIKSWISRIESDLGLIVVIAGHPKVEDVNASQIYGDSVFIKNKTPELVFHSELVICSCSTAMSYAVLMRKPIIFITTNEIEKDSEFRDLIARMSSWFGTRRINIDNISDIEKISVPDINEKYYSSYETSFLMEENIINNAIWPTVANRHEEYTSKQA